MIRSHIDLARGLFETVSADPRFEILSPLRLSLFSFRCRPAGLDDEAELDALNLRLIETLNDSGQIYLTQNRVRGKFAIRFQVGQTNTEARHIDAAWSLIQRTASELSD
jgi:aromatic-L-amino-acid decarboxylase